MRIISDYHDYYDCMMTPGVQEPLWLRNQMICHHDKNNSQPMYGWPWPFVNRWTVACDSQIIGFCGKVEKCLVFTEANGTYEGKDIRCYDADCAIRQLESRERKKWCQMWKRRKWGPYVEIPRFFAASMPSVLINNNFVNAPIWIAESWAMLTTFNPCLRDIEYQKRVPPPQAYQELAMWIGNLASPEKPLPKIDDVTLAESKGFDKHSFRKEPSATKKRPRRSGS